MKILHILGLGAVLAGCQTTAELEYRAAPLGTDWDTVEKNARDGFEYVELQATYIKVGLDDSAKTPPADTGQASTATKTIAQGTVGESSTGQTKKVKAAPLAKTPSPATGAKATPAENETPKKDDAAKKDEVKASPPKEPSQKDGTKDAASSPQVLDPVLATTLIDGRTWTAKTVPVPSAQLGFLVKGQTSSFWKQTTLSVAKYANSDLPSGVSVKAENLVATRIGQAAGIVAKLVTAAGVLGVSSSVNTPKAPLLPFSVKVGDENDAGDLNDGWSYKLKFDDTLPKNVVKIDDFLGKMAGKKVNYWPVPACRAATLSVFGGDKAYEFRVIVASPSYVRLQPVPVDGKIAPGSICSSSTTGTMVVDPMATLADQVSALQAGIQTIKDAKDGKDGKVDDKSKDDKSKAEVK